MSALEPRKHGLFYHVPVREGEVPRYVLLPGAPERVDVIASKWDEVRIRRQVREFRVAIGVYRGVEVAAVSTGIGGPSTSIAIEELARAGARTLIRVGTCGAIQNHVEVGDIVIAHGAVRYDGASPDYAPPEYPAVSDPLVLQALIEAAERLGVRYHVGLVASTASFYLGQSRPGFQGYTWPPAEQRLELMRRLGVLCFEMEAAALFVASSVYGLRAGCVCAAVANRLKNVFRADAGVENAIEVALEAVRILAALGDAKPVPSLVAGAAESLGKAARGDKA